MHCQSVWQGTTFDNKYYDNTTTSIPAKTHFSQTQRNDKDCHRRKTLWQIVPVVNRMTLTSYLEYICDSFLVEKATRYDVKGKRYIDSPYKYYFTDCGLRNALLNFRQTEPSHLMENVIYNELRVRGFNVDVGVVPVQLRKDDGSRERKHFEVDFVCNMGSKRYYIQSAYRMPDEEKMKQEEASLRNINDSFKKIIIVGEDTPVLRNEAGITTIGIYDFLLNENSLDL